MKTVQNYIMFFNLPFAFDVENSAAQEHKGSPYLLTIDNIPALLRFERVYDFRYKDANFLSPFSKTDQDRSGLLSYTRVQVWYDRQTFQKHNLDTAQLHNQTEFFIDLCIKYINKFINSYKIASEQFWLRHLVRKDIFNLGAILFYNDKTQENLVSVLVPSHQVVQFNGGKDFALSQEQDELLRQILTSSDYDFHSDMEFHMLDNYHLGYYNIALIQSVILFENFIHTFVRKKLSKTKYDKIKKKVDCGCIVGISEVCERGFKEYFDFDFGTTVEFQAVKENALLFRNKIVHGEIMEDIGEEKCFKAIDAVVKAQKLLYERVFSKLEDNKE
jgi:hypothetical protein